MYYTLPGRCLEEAISNFAGSTLVISHDRWFLDRVATHILAFEGDSKVGQPGDSCPVTHARAQEVVCAALVTTDALLHSIGVARVLAQQCTAGQHDQVHDEHSVQAGAVLAGTSQACSALGC